MGDHWHIGMEVECIKDAVQKVTDLGFPYFKKGDRYTIAGFDTHPDYGLFLSFAECDPRHLGHEDGFRPIQKPKTDISVFTDMLNIVNATVDA